MSLTDVPPQPERKKSLLRTIMAFVTAAVVFAGLYAAWMFYSRYQANQDEQKQIEAKRDEKVQADKRWLNQIYGSGDVHITAFSADKGLLSRGEKTSLCYGAVNAKVVSIVPTLAEPVKPTYRHCTEIAPKVTTTYTLTAEDVAGHKKSESLTIRVQ